ncbi:MAG: hypothetical protein ACXVBE_07200 [Bdellovibrionota bacterium]
MKTIYTLTALMLLTTTAHAESLAELRARTLNQKAIYCEDNQFARDGGKAVALFRPLGNGSVKASAYSFGNNFGGIVTSGSASVTFDICELSTKAISCVSDRRAADGALQTMELGTAASPNALSYHSQKSKGFTGEQIIVDKKFAVAAKDCREVEGTELAKLVKVLEAEPVYGVREVPAEKINTEDGDNSSSSAE